MALHWCPRVTADLIGLFTWVSRPKEGDKHSRPTRLTVYVTYVACVSCRTVAGVNYLRNGEFCNRNAKFESETGNVLDHAARFTAPPCMPRVDRGGGGVRVRVVVSEICRAVSVRPFFQLTGRTNCRQC